MKHVDTINLSGIALQSLKWVTDLIVGINEGAKVAKPLTLFEHETIPFEWSDRDLRAIERLRAATGQEILRPIISRGHRRDRGREPRHPLFARRYFVLACPASDAYTKFLGGAFTSRGVIMMLHPRVAFQVGALG